MPAHPDAPAAAPAEAARLGPTSSGRKSPVAIPWRDIACRLAGGEKPAAIAVGLGLAEERIWRHLRKSLRFRFYLRQAIERQQMLAGLQLAAIGRNALLERGLKPDSLDGDLLRLLAEAPPDTATSADLAKQVERLGETGGPPPNMAFRARIAAERKIMDAEVAEVRAFVVRLRQAALARANAGEAVRSAANTSEAPRSETNASEPVRSATNTGEAARSATNTGEAARTSPAPVEPPRRPPPKSVEPVGRGAVDLPGPDLEWLRAQGMLSRPES